MRDCPSEVDVQNGSDDYTIVIATCFKSNFNSSMSISMKSRASVALAVTMSLTSSAFADGATDARGLWLTVEQDAVIEFAPCASQPVSLCARIVWDKDAGTASSTCGVQIAQLDRYDGSAWRDGWVYDPRDKKKYKAVVRAKGRELAIRAYVGVEVLGQTEALKRVNSLPATPTCGS
jgi:uncharacterized protein (DUF2147 family)